MILKVEKTFKCLKIKTSSNILKIQIKNHFNLSTSYYSIYLFSVCLILVMRLGKKKEKEKDLDPKNQVIDSVLRLICSPKTHNYPLTSKILLSTFIILTFNYT